MVIDIKTGKASGIGVVSQNSLKAWILAARPKTLSGAMVPVMLGTAFAWKTIYDTNLLEMHDDELIFRIVANVLCFLFAMIMQIDANFVNDYFDCVHGNDNETRLGPERACAMGWVSLKAMRWAMAITTTLAALVGLPLIFFGGWEMVLVGALCILFCFLYTTCLAGMGMGDLLVLVFFGIVPVCFTSYIVCGVIPWVLGVACGLVVDTLLIVNNYRDIDNDRNAGKRTLVVMIGSRYAEWLYITLPTLALVAVLFQYGWSEKNMLLCFCVYFLFVQSWNQMRMIKSGRALNKILGKTARNIFLFGILISLLVIFS
jgi:1,4-dihydroxy-2-naphthoate octaprenyltransferase